MAEGLRADLDNTPKMMIPVFIGKRSEADA